LYDWKSCSTTNRAWLQIAMIWNHVQCQIEHDRKSCWTSNRTWRQIIRIRNLHDPKSWEIANRTWLGIWMLQIGQDDKWCLTASDWKSTWHEIMLDSDSKPSKTVNRAWLTSCMTPNQAWRENVRAEEQTWRLWLHCANRVRFQIQHDVKSFPWRQSWCVIWNHTDVSEPTPPSMTTNQQCMTTWNRGNVELDLHCMTSNHALQLCSLRKSWTIAWTMYSTATLRYRVCLHRRWKSSSGAEVCASSTRNRTEKLKASLSCTTRNRIELFRWIDLTYIQSEKCDIKMQPTKRDHDQKSWRYDI
jgi:hypothetical protein